MFKKPIALIKKFFSRKPPKLEVAKLAPEPGIKRQRHMTQEESEALAKYERKLRLDWWKGQVTSTRQRLNVNCWRAKKRMSVLSRRAQRT